MKRRLIVAFAAAALIVPAAGPTNTYAPGSRTQVLSHNAYPDHGKYADRLDRTLAAGLPVAIEEDLAWIDGKSLLIHGAKNATPDDPTLESYFFPKVKPIIEKALKDGNKGNWPLITLYLDIKNDPPEHLAVINKMLDKYDAWLTKAEKTADIAKQSPLELKPMMVIVEDKQGDIKQKVFYDDVPVGGKIRVFGSAEKFDENPQKLPREKKDEAVAMMVDSRSRATGQQEGRQLPALVRNQLGLRGKGRRNQGWRMDQGIGSAPQEVRRLRPPARLFCGGLLSGWIHGGRKPGLGQGLQFRL